VLRPRGVGRAAVGSLPAVACAALSQRCLHATLLWLQCSSSAASKQAVQPHAPRVEASHCRQQASRSPFPPALRPARRLQLPACGPSRIPRRASTLAEQCLLAGACWPCSGEPGGPLRREQSSPPSARLSPRRTWPASVPGPSPDPPPAGSRRTTTVREAAARPLHKASLVTRAAVAWLTSLTSLHPVMLRCCDRFPCAGALQPPLSSRLALLLHMTLCSALRMWGSAASPPLQWTQLQSALIYYPASSPAARRRGAPTCSAPACSWCSSSWSVCRPRGGRSAQPLLLLVQHHWLRITTPCCCLRWVTACSAASALVAGSVLNTAAPSAACICASAPALLLIILERSVLSTHASRHH
jgi:hypothetical protein